MSGAGEKLPGGYVLGEPGALAPGFAVFFQRWPRRTNPAAGVSAGLRPRLARDFPRRFGKTSAPPGFSLLEVILALAILTGALVLLGEFARLGAANAGMAQNVSQAQLLCESKLAEIVSGVTQPTADSDVLQADNDDSPQWNYTVDVEPVENQSVQNLLAVTVTVTQDLPQENHPASCMLTRWISDPNATYTTSSSNSSVSGNN